MHAQVLDQKLGPSAARKSGNEAQAGAVSNSDFSIRPRPGSPAIFYRDVPLWDTVAANFDRYEFFLAERDYAWGDRWELTCRDDCGDYFSWGDWTTLAAPMSWLQNSET